MAAREKFLAEIEAFLKRSGMSATRGFRKPDCARWYHSRLGRVSLPEASIVFRSLLSVILLGSIRAHDSRF